MHIPVLLKELIFYLNPKAGDTILDATINGGGHATKILKAIGKNGQLIGIEQDAKILKSLQAKIEKKEFGNDNVILINGNFRNLDTFEPLKNKKINGAIFDLGISTLQLEESGRGFSFQKNEPLLMNLKSDLGPDDLTAEEIINKWSEKEIADVIYEYGEERYSRRIAKKIVDERRKKAIKTTFDLIEIIRTSIPWAYRNNRRINCATRTFQALRIAVNDELGAAEEAIEKAFNLISENGRLIVISFHSLEDRIIKNFFKKIQKEGKGEILTKKPIVPSKEEAKENPASRSAKLRAIVKI